jgi:hypothetical protein
MSSKLELQAAELKHTELGQKGVILLTDTTSITGDFRKIQALTATVFNTLTSDITKNGTSTAAVAADFGTLAAGQSICGKFTEVKLTSGIAILYK